MPYNFKKADRDQLYLIPPDIREWLPKDDLAWVIMDAVEQMDLEAIYKKYRKDGVGGEGYEPSILLSVLLYSYCKGMRSSRKIEILCERDVGFRVISANSRPDHTTISRFQNRNRKEIGELFTDVLRLCAEAGLVKAGKVYLDGSKMKANAALSSNRTYETIKEDIRKWLRELDKTDREEDRLYGKDRRGDEIPEELANPDSRIKRLKECKERLEREASEAEKEEAKKTEERKVKEEEEALKGKKVRGRKPKPLDEKKKEEKKPCANTTDPDSRIMKTRKGYIQGYNA